MDQTKTISLTDSAYSAGAIYQVGDIKDLDGRTLNGFLRKINPTNGTIINSRSISAITGGQRSHQVRVKKVLASDFIWVLGDTGAKLTLDPATRVVGRDYVEATCLYSQESGDLPNIFGPCGSRVSFIAKYSSSLELQSVQYLQPATTTYLKTFEYGDDDHYLYPQPIHVELDAALLEGDSVFLGGRIPKLASFSSTLQVADPNLALRNHDVWLARVALDGSSVKQIKFGSDATDQLFDMKTDERGNLITLTFDGLNRTLSKYSRTLSSPIRRSVDLNDLVDTGAYDRVSGHQYRIELDSSGRVLLLTLTQGAYYDDRDYLIRRVEFSIVRYPKSIWWLSSGNWANPEDWATIREQDIDRSSPLALSFESLSDTAIGSDGTLHVLGSGRKASFLLGINPTGFSFSTKAIERQDVDSLMARSLTIDLPLRATFASGECGLRCTFLWSFGI